MKILFHTPTGETKEYNRTDDQSPVGLSSDYEVYELLEQDEPDYNPTTHYLQAVEQIDHDNKQFLRSWQIVPRVPSPAEIIAARRAAMAAIFDAQPVAVQAAFYAARIAAEAAMDRGRFDVARALIADLAVPPDLEPVKAAILNQFPTL